MRTEEKLTIDSEHRLIATGELNEVEKVINRIAIVLFYTFLIESAIVSSGVTKRA